MNAPPMFSPALGICAILVFSACSSFADTPRSDQAIYRDIQHSFGSIPELRTSQLNVQVRDGLVAVRGHVDSLNQHQQVIHKVTKVRGVVYLVDTLFIIGSERRKEAAVRQNLAATLRLDTQLDYLNLQVTTKGSHHHISGLIIHPSQEKRIRKVARQVPDVNRITTDLHLSNALTER
ncbi:BON domain-containing protein [Verrucomicrobiaceae bacterium R5-34]|nr:BON domain-containing protein [Verrucomicrobiaceae bacterium R5-34]